MLVVAGLNLRDGVPDSAVVSDRRTVSAQDDRVHPTRLAVLSRQCLNRRLPGLAAVQTEVTAWETQRNRERPTVKWHFRIADARRKLDHLYPNPA